MLILLDEIDWSFDEFTSPLKKELKIKQGLVQDYSQRL